MDISGIFIILQIGDIYMSHSLGIILNNIFILYIYSYEWHVQDTNKCNYSFIYFSKVMVLLMKQQL